MAECMASVLPITYSVLYLIAGVGGVVLGQIAGAVVHIARRTGAV
jgi:hypothetical protein